MARGKFITLEGGEGAGKSTQCKRLADYLRSKGIEVVQTREVGGSPSAEAIRELWLTAHEGHWDGLTELLLIMAARREHLVKTIWPAMTRGAWVVCDRFIDSTRAYQGIGLGVGLEVIEDIYQRIAPNFEADLTLLLDLPVKTGLARVTSRGGQDDRYQQKNIEFHQILREAYRSLATHYAQRFRIVDATGEASSVTTTIEKIIAEYFGI